MPLTPSQIEDLQGLRGDSAAALQNWQKIKEAHKKASAAWQPLPSTGNDKEDHTSPNIPTSGPSAAPVQYPGGTMGIPGHGLGLHPNLTPTMGSKTANAGWSTLGENPHLGGLMGGQGQSIGPQGIHVVLQSIESAAITSIALAIVMGLKNSTKPGGGGGLGAGIPGGGGQRADARPWWKKLIQGETTTDDEGEQRRTPGLLNRAKSALNPEEGAAHGIGQAFGAVGDAGKMIPGIGPVVGAIGKLGEVTFGAVDKLNKWTDNLHEANMKFAYISGSMAAVQAEYNAERMMIDEQKGEELAATAESAAQAKLRADRAWLPLEVGLKKVSNQISEIFSDMREGLGDFLTWLTGQKNDKDREDVDKKAHEGQRMLEEWGRPLRHNQGK